MLTRPNADLLHDSSMLVPRGELFVGVLGPMSVRDWGNCSPFPAILHGPNSFPTSQLGKLVYECVPGHFSWNRRVASVISGARNTSAQKQL